jgi:hypothetical protein
VVSNCALVLLNESDKIPLKGGVIPPGFAFERTSLKDRLMKDGMKFDVITNNSTVNANL